MHNAQPTNRSCHNLCTRLTPPFNFETLLGLGLNFCPVPRSVTTSTDFSNVCDRFRRDAHTKAVFATKYPSTPPSLFIRSNWEPDPYAVPNEISGRVSRFLAALQPHFQRSRRTRANLLPHQVALLHSLRQSDDFIVFPSDKNLGPVILERDEYIRRVFLDHLYNPSVYELLTPTYAEKLVREIREKLTAFTEEQFLSRDDRTFIRQSMEVEDPYSYFYITAKVHKTPWATRPIVSYSGSLLHGLGRWIDHQLQPICKKIPSYISSSSRLKRQLQSLDIDLSRASFFTADATAMYTNIDTDHALAILDPFLRFNPLCEGIPAELILKALELVMRNNLFKFGDCLYLQKTGTAMGAPPACVYAILYYGIHEMDFYPRFQSSIPFYRRYIDDCFGIWIHDKDPAFDAIQWNDFKSALPFKKLQWTVSSRERTTDFLDLTITINDANKIETRLFEKPLNKYLYLPPHSCHAPGVFNGFIKGMIL